MLHAVCNLVRRDSSTIKFDRVVIAFILLAKHYPMIVGRRPEYPEKTPDDELKKMPHTKARKFEPRPRLEPAL